MPRVYATKRKDDKILDNLTGFERKKFLSLEEEIRSRQLERARIYSQFIGPINAELDVLRKRKERLYNKAHCRQRYLRSKECPE